MRKKNSMSGLEKIRAELAAARQKREELDARIKGLEEKLAEQEAAKISDIIRRTKITPEQFAALLAAAGVGELSQNTNEEETENED